MRSVTQPSRLLRPILLSTLLILGLIASIVGAGSAQAGSNQFTLFNQTTTHKATNYAQVSIGGPSNWSSPTNYSSGNLYLRLEVAAKPSNKAVDVQLCAWRNKFSDETCSPKTRISTTGV